MEKIIHEMSTPIQNISLLSELMLNKQPDIAKLNGENINYIHEATNKLKQIVCLLSSITNLKSDEIKINLEKVDLIELVQREVKYNQTRNKLNTDLKIDVASKVQTCITKVDKFWFTQLLTNLLTNAVNHCEKGIIEVYTDIVIKNEKDYFCLQVSDEGCGIADSELESIFLPLERGTHSIGKVAGLV